MPSPRAWSADEVLSAAKWIFGSPGLVWSPTPGAGGHKQIRIKFAVINHWNSGVVNVQGRDAHLVAEKLLSTRQLSAHHSPVPDSGWLPNSRRRKRFSPSPDSRISSTGCRSPPAPPPFTPSPQRIPPDLSRFSALSSHDLDLPDPAPLPFSSPPHPLDASPLRRSIVTQTVPPLSSVRPRELRVRLVHLLWTEARWLEVVFLLLSLSLSGVRVLAQLCHSAGSVFDLLPAFAICPFARKSRIVRSLPVSGVLQSTGSQKRAGGRSLGLESIGHRPPVRPLWKRSLFWVCRLACMASVILLSITLCLACPGCYAFSSCFQSCPDSLSRSSSVDTSHVSGPASTCHFTSLSDRPCLF